MSKILFIACFTTALTAVLSQTDADENPSDDTPAALNFRMNRLDGTPVDLAQYEGKVILLVNVASKCGLTPQYEPLQALYEKYGERGLVVLAFPCNQFLSQEPGTAEEIREFCSTRYGVTFDLFAKVNVNGPEACDLYKYLTSLDTQPVGAGPISWNFEKFLLDRQGRVVARFSPRTVPDAPELIGAIERELEKK